MSPFPERVPDGSYFFLRYFHDPGGPAVVGPAPGRPETLRRHLSVGLPFAKSWECLSLDVDRRCAHAAGRKSIGYRIVIAGTALAPKSKPLTRSTTCAVSSGAFMSDAFSSHNDTEPSGSIVSLRIT